MRWRPDEVDTWCEQWAKERRKALGIANLEPRDRLGALRCTLAAIKTDGDNGAYGTVSQQFPEVYLGTALLVNRALKEMNPRWRHIVDMHYTLKWVKASIKARELEVSTASYWQLLAQGKGFIHGFVMVHSENHLDSKDTMKQGPTPCAV
jgi:hypothetical protein